MKHTPLLLSLLVALALPACAPPSSGPSSSETDKHGSAGVDVTFLRSADFAGADIEIECPYDEGCEAFINMCVTGFSGPSELSPDMDTFTFGHLLLTAPNGQARDLYGYGGLCQPKLFRTIFVERGYYTGALTADPYDRSVADQHQLSSVTLNVTWEVMPLHSLPCRPDFEGDTCELSCDDGADGDGDNRTDCDDPDCAGTAACDDVAPPANPEDADQQVLICDAEGACETELAAQVSTGQSTLFTLHTLDAALLVVTVDPAGGGDADLFVRGPADTTCASLNGAGTRDQCLIVAPPDGEYTIEVWGFSDASFNVFAMVDPAGSQVIDLPRTALARDAQQSFTFSVPADATSVEVSLQQQSGDTTLYVNPGFAPDGPTGWQCAKVLPRGEDKLCPAIMNPTPGVWHVMAEGAADGISEALIRVSIGH